MLVKTTTGDRGDFLFKLHSTQKGITVKANVLFIGSILYLKKKEKQMSHVKDQESE